MAYMKTYVTVAIDIVICNVNLSPASRPSFHRLAGFHLIIFVLSYIIIIVVDIV